MSNKERKPAFDTEAASTVGLPSPQAFAPPPAPVSEVPHVTAPTTPAPPSPRTPQIAASSSQPTDPPSKTRARRKYRYPDAMIASDLAQTLRLTALREKASDPVHARSHGLIVKQAINKHAKGIQAALTPDAASNDDLLFPESPESVARRKYPPGKKPERVTLSGMTAKDTAVLDRLAKQWADGNRSALVEAALRLEFGKPEEPVDTYFTAE